MTFVKSDYNLPSLICGGGQERGRRAGTENILAISSLAHMVDQLDQLEESTQRVEKLRNHLQELILKPTFQESWSMEQKLQGE
ncbi:MAG: hypothetical protein R2827_05245 [Bdellovibrionales bacterium]